MFDHTSYRGLRDRVRRWATFGFAIGCLYALYAVGLYVVRGSTPFERNGLSLLGLVVAYLGAGIVAGGLIGALFPLTRWQLGFITVAIVAAFAGVVGVAMAGEGFITRWSGDIWLACAGTAVLLGTMVSAMIWLSRHLDRRL